MNANFDFSHRYSNGIHNKRVAVLGIYPPPFGGVSVHVQRVIHKLRLQNNTVYFFTTEPRYRYKLFFFYKIKLFLWLYWYKPSVIFYNSVYLDNSLGELQLLAQLKRRLKYKLVLIEHNCRHMYQRSNRFKKGLSDLLEQINTIIFIGTSTLASYQDNHVSVKNYSVEGAFLPPDISYEQSILQSYPRSLFQFLKRYCPIMVVNASQQTLIDGKDLYGIDQCLQLLARMKNLHPAMGLVIAFGHNVHKTYFDYVHEQIKELALSDQVYIVHGQKELWPLLKRADFFVRPSLKDGASVSVQEALHFSVPAVVSNVCLRPEGTIVFEVGNHKDLYEKVMKVLQNNEYANSNKQCDYLHTQ